MLARIASQASPDLFGPGHARSDGSKAIDALRFFAIFFMTYAHYEIDLTSFLPRSVLSGVAHISYTILHFGLSRTASAFLGIVSGYFLYQQLTRMGYRRTLSRRFRSLMIPEVTWSALYLVVEAIRALAKHGKPMAGYLHTPWRSFNLLVPIQYWPANLPLHYLADLFKLCLISPLILLILRRLSPRTKIALLIVLFLVPNSFDPSNMTSIIPRWDLVVFFVAGMMIASEFIDLGSLVERRIPAYVVAAAFVGIVAIAPHWEPLMRDVSPYKMYLGYLLVMLVKVFGIGLFVGVVQRLIRFKGLSAFLPSRNVTFLAFCTHAIVLIFLAKATSMMVNYSGMSDLPIFISFLVFPFVCFALVYVSTDGWATARRTLGWIDPAVGEH